MSSLFGLKMEMFLDIDAYYCSPDQNQSKYTMK